MCWKILSILMLSGACLFLSPHQASATGSTTIPIVQNRPEDHKLRMLVDRIKRPCRARGTSRDLIAISQYGSRAEPAIPDILPMLQCEFPNVRAAAVQTLGAIGTSDDVLDYIVTGLRDQDPLVRESAAAALGIMGSQARKAVPHLLESLTSDFWRVRKATAEALGNIGDKTAVMPLVQTLKEPGTRPSSHGQEVRAAAARALGKIGDKRAIKPLLDAVKNDPDIRQTAAEALKNINAPGMLKKLDVKK